MALAFVNRAGTNGATTSNATSLATNAASHTANNFLAVNIQYQKGASVTSVTDTAGNTYHRAYKYNQVGNNVAEIWYAYNITGNASNIVTAAIGGGGTIYGHIMANQFSGMGSSDPLTSIAYGSASGTTLTTGTLHVGSSDAVIIAALCANSGGLGAGTGYTLTTEAQTGDATAYFGDEYHLISADEAATGTCTSASNGIVAACFTASGTKPSLPTFVNRAEPDAPTTGSVSTLKSEKLSVVAGNLLCVKISYQSSATVSTISDTAGNTYHNKVSALASGNNRTDIWYAYNITGHATNVVTIALSAGSTYGHCSVQQFSGLGTADPFGDVQSATGTSTAADSGNVTVTGTNAMIFAAGSSGGSNVAGTGYTLFVEGQTGDPNTYFPDEYHIVTASEHATFACTPNWAIGAVSFNAPATGGFLAARPVTILQAINRAATY